MSNRKIATRPAGDVIEDHLKTREEWNKLKIEVLKLKCNQYALIANGKKTTLTKRLFDHFQERREVRNNEAPINIEHETNEMATASSNEEPNLVLLEIRALRSEVAAMKEKQRMQELQQKNSCRTDDSEHRISTIPNTERDGTNGSELVRGFHVPAFIEDSGMSMLTGSNQAKNPNVNINMVEDGTCNSRTINNTAATGRLIVDSNNYVSSQENPFIPPPIKIIMLKKIEKGDYVDLEDLLPSHPASKNNERQFDIDFENEAIRLKPKEKKSITNMTQWMAAWNNYVQALLHFKPALFYKLFTYQKNLCRAALKYKFEACYGYDKDFRLLIASQISLSPQQRSAKWEEIHAELASMYFQPDALLPSCYHCRVVGHYASSCPLKLARSNNVEGRSVNTMVRDTGEQFRNAPQLLHNNTQLPRYGQWSSSTITNKTQGGKSNIRSCNRFNKGQFCAKPPCSYTHVCNRCNQAGHAGIQCNNVTNTNFNP